MTTTKDNAAGPVVVGLREGQLRRAQNLLRTVSPGAVAALENALAGGAAAEKARQRELARRKRLKGDPTPRVMALLAELPDSHLRLMMQVLEDYISQRDRGSIHAYGGRGE